MKVLILHLSTDPNSKTMAELTLDSAIYNTGYEPLLVNALDGSSGKVFLDSNNIQLQKGLAQLSPDAVGSIASHIALWNHCVQTNEAIIIAEHSALFLRNWDNPEFEDVLRLNCFGPYIGSNAQEEDSLINYHSRIKENGVLAYAIKPQAAIKLLNNCSVNGYSHTDKLMAEPVISIETIHPPIAQEQLPRYGDMNLNKTIHIIWVGDETKRPDPYIDSWRKLNPDWHVKVWGNTEYKEYPWALRKQLNHRMDITHELNGVADIMRWEILFNEGGFAVDADGPCIKPLEDWLFQGAKMAVCFESERGLPGRLASGYIYAEKANPIIKSIIEGIASQPQCDFIPAWRSLGPMPLSYQYHKLRPSEHELRVWPSHYFIPDHRWAPSYEGPGPVFARQMFMSTHGTYKNFDEYDANADVYSQRLK